ncbi:DUF4303 domain-containing protein [Rhodococcus gannanensis]|uniref:DUF4303 domain-containing protein n=1 Tax=Rhodococcus gannanensis TaxID=1960308 RepID=A0ABW4NXX4_9NOCA
MDVAAVVHDRIVEFVRQVRAEHPSDRIYGAAVHEFYAEHGGVIYWPMIGVASEESLASVTTERFDAEALRWSPADWPWQLDPNDADDALAEAITAAATAGDDAAWERAHRRFERDVVRACTRARRTLIADDVVGREFVAVAMDEAWELVPLCLSKAQVRKHFPELDEEQQAIDRISALDRDEQVAELIGIIEAPVSPPPGSERATEWLREVGAAAAPAVRAHLTTAREKWRWAKLLGELGDSSPDVITALAAVVGNRRLGEADRAWAAAALARLDRMDLLVPLLDRLPREVAVRGLSAPYTSFRDLGVPTPLDYRPLDAALTAAPDLHEPVCERLSPGSGFCEIRPDEIASVLDGLDSRWAAVRRHALFVLADANLTDDQRGRHRTALRNAECDPDPRLRDAVAVIRRRDSP